MQNTNYQDSRRLMSYPPRPSHFNPYSNLTVSRITGSHSLSDKQIQRLFAIAHSKRWSRQDVMNWAERHFLKRSPHQLTRLQYERLCQHILENPARFVGEVRA